MIQRLQTLFLLFCGINAANYFSCRTFFVELLFETEAALFESITFGVYALIVFVNILFKPSYAPDAGESRCLGSYFPSFGGGLFYRSNQSCEFLTYLVNPRLAFVGEAMLLFLPIVTSRQDEALIRSIGPFTLMLSAFPQFDDFIFWSFPSSTSKRSMVRI